VRAPALLLPWVKGEAARRKARRRAGSQTLIAMAGRPRSRIGGARARLCLRAGFSARRRRVQVAVASWSRGVSSTG
jgi:hypothetical protein